MNEPKGLFIVTVIFTRSENHSNYVYVVASSYNEAGEKAVKFYEDHTLSLEAVKSVEFIAAGHPLNNLPKLLE